MARSYQYIRTKYWENARRAKLSPDEILIELYLITNRNCGMSGAQQISTDGISYYLGMSKINVARGLAKLTAKKRIIQFPGDWILICGKWDNEASKSPKVVTGLKSELSTVPREVSDTFSILYPALNIEPYQYPNDILPIPNPLEEEGEVVLELELEKEVPSGRTPTAPPSDKSMAMVAELFPGEKSTVATAQAKVLDEIERLDKEDLDKLLPILKWAKDDKFWSGNFGSCASLRKRKNGPGDQMKYQKIRASYESTQKAVKPDVKPFV